MTTAEWESSVYTSPSASTTHTIDIPAHNDGDVVYIFSSSAAENDSVEALNGEAWTEYVAFAHSGINTHIWYVEATSDSAGEEIDVTLTSSAESSHLVIAGRLLPPSGTGNWARGQGLNDFADPFSVARNSSNPTGVVLFLTWLAKGDPPILSRPSATDANFTTLATSVVSGTVAHLHADYYQAEGVTTYDTDEYSWDNNSSYVIYSNAIDVVPIVPDITLPLITPVTLFAPTIVSTQAIELPLINPVTIYETELTSRTITLGLLSPVTIFSPALNPPQITQLGLISPTTIFAPLIAKRVDVRVEMYLNLEMSVYAEITLTVDPTPDNDDPLEYTGTLQLAEDAASGATELTLTATTLTGTVEAGDSVTIGSTTFIITASATATDDEITISIFPGLDNEVTLPLISPVNIYSPELVSNA